MFVSKDGYGARVSNLHMYDSVSCDLIGRWAYPITPEANFSDEEGRNCTHSRHNVYREVGVGLGHGSLMEENVLIGQNTVIGANCSLSNTVIGANCLIGNTSCFLPVGMQVVPLTALCHTLIVLCVFVCLLGNGVVLDRAFIWNNVHIGDGVTVRQSVICDDVEVKRSVTLKPQCVLAYGVRTHKLHCTSSTCNTFPDADLLFVGGGGARHVSPRRDSRVSASPRRGGGRR